MNPDCTVLSASDQRFCEAVGFYDTTRSSTAVALQTTKTLRYGIGAANITYVRDSLALAGSRTTMQQVQFGVASSSEDQFAGILGIGYGEGVNTRYKNLIDELAAQGVTRTKAFSIGLGSKDEQEGAIIFGGIDTNKFSGALARLPIVPADQSPDGVARYWVNMNSLSLTPPSRRTRVYPNSSMPVFLDSGATLTLLPESLASTVASDFGSPGLDANGFYPVSCTLVNLNGTVDFDFDGMKIQVPYKEMIRELHTTPPTCYLGIVPNADFTLLGDTFLRSAYGAFATCFVFSSEVNANRSGSRVRPRHQRRLPGTVRQLWLAHNGHQPSGRHHGNSGPVPGCRRICRHAAGNQHHYHLTGIRFRHGVWIESPNRPPSGNVGRSGIGRRVSGLSSRTQHYGIVRKHAIGGEPRVKSCGWDGHVFL